MQIAKPQSQSIDLVNKCLEGIGESPVTKRKLQSKKYVAEKIGVITGMMESLMISDDSRSNTNIDSEIIQQLKDNFESTDDRALLKSKY